MVFDVCVWIGGMGISLDLCSDVAEYWYALTDLSSNR